MGIAVTLRVFVPFALGYYMSYVFRAINAVMAPDLVRDFALDANDLGLLTSTYFLTFAAVQLPLGVILDRVGPRRTETVLLMIAALGAVVFATATSLTGLAIGRGLIGLGVSACLMAAVTAFARVYPPERLALVNGWVFTAGGLGAITATTPVEIALGFTDWRGVFFTLAGITALAGAIIYFVAQDHAAADRIAEKPGLAAQIGEIRQILAHPAFTRYIPLAIVTQSANLSMPTLWAGPWLRDVAGLDRATTATTLMLIACGLMAGFFTWGLLAERLAKRGIDTATTMVAVSLVYMTVQLTIILGIVDSPRVLWVLFSFTGTVGSLAYAALSQQFPARLAGRVNTVLNLFVFLGAFAAQWGIGAIIDLWPHTESGQFAKDGYNAAFAAMLAIEVAAALWLGFMRAVRPSSLSK